MSQRACIPACLPLCVTMSPPVEPVGTSAKCPFWQRRLSLCLLTSMFQSYTWRRHGEVKSTKEQQCCAHSSIRYNGESGTSSDASRPFMALIDCCLVCGIH